jgi:hypothetical protein
MSQVHTTNDFAFANAKGSRVLSLLWRKEVFSLCFITKSSVCLLINFTPEISEMHNDDLTVNANDS